MSGRVGMTGDMVVRGDARVAKADESHRRRSAAQGAGAAGLTLPTTLHGGIGVGAAGTQFYRDRPSAWTGAKPMSLGRRVGRAAKVGSGVVDPKMLSSMARNPKQRGYFAVLGALGAGGAIAGGIGGAAGGGHKPVAKVDTTMSERQAHQLARQYDTRGPLPKGLDRPTKMRAYEARYIAAGGKKAEKWQRRASGAEVSRNIGLAGATGATGLLMAARGRRLGPQMARLKVTPGRAETGALGSALLGGASELYGEHARSRRASYANSPAGIAGSALTRMRAYTPEQKRTS